VPNNQLNSFLQSPLSRQWICPLEFVCNSRLLLPQPIAHSATLTQVTGIKDFIKDSNVTVWRCVTWYTPTNICSTVYLLIQCETWKMAAIESTDFYATYLQDCTVSHTRRTIFIRNSSHTHNLVFSVWYCKMFPGVVLFTFSLDNISCSVYIYTRIFAFFVGVPLCDTMKL